MSGASFESLYDLGYAICGSILGKPYAQYRPNGSGNPISINNLVASVNVYLTTDPNLMGKTQLQFGKAVWYGAFDRATINVGDYLIGPIGTFFVSATTYPGATSLVQCNHKLTLTRLPETVTPGAQSSYGGDVLAQEQTILSAWPVSMLIAGTKATPGTMQLPNDGKMGTIQAILPASVPVALFYNDILTDENGDRYSVSSAELSALGWRLNAEQWAV